jgi:hypothetical protein
MDIFPSSGAWALEALVTVFGAGRGWYAAMRRSFTKGFY